jgi:hypothetical protein
MMHVAEVPRVSRRSAGGVAVGPEPPRMAAESVEQVSFGKRTQNERFQCDAMARALLCSHMEGGAYLIGETLPAP